MNSINVNVNDDYFCESDHEDMREEWLKEQEEGEEGEGEEGEEGEGEEGEEGEEEVGLKSRRRQSWGDIMKRENKKENKKESKKESKKEKLEEKEEKEEPCAICYECFTETDACATTPCGHKFHSTWLFKNFEHRPECPLCRTELIKQKEDEEDVESYYSDSEGSEEDDEEEEEEEEDGEELKQLVSIKQLADKLFSLGYTMEDILMLHFGSDHPKDIANPRYSADLNDDADENSSTSSSTSSPTSSPTLSVGSHILEYNDEDQTFYPESKSVMLRLTSDIDNIFSGILAVKYTDVRTYAQVASSSQ